MLGSPYLGKLPSTGCPLGSDQKDPASSDPGCGKVTNRPPMSPNGDSVDPDPIEAKGVFQNVPKFEGPQGRF